MLFQHIQQNCKEQFKNCENKKELESFRQSDQIVLQFVSKKLSPFPLNEVSDSKEEYHGNDQDHDYERHAHKQIMILLNFVTEIFSTAHHILHLLLSLQPIFEIFSKINH